MQSNKSQVKNLVLAGMFLAIGIIMPKLFHIAGPQAGKMFLPLFWGVTLAAAILPLKYAALIAVILPILSNLISAMPPVPMLYFMLIELVVCAVSIHLLLKKCNPFVAVGLSFVISRIAYMLSVLCAATLLHLPAPFTTFAALLSSVLISLPGIVMQVILVPLVYKLYYRTKNHG